MCSSKRSLCGVSRGNYLTPSEHAIHLCPRSGLLEYFQDPVRINHRMSSIDLNPLGFGFDADSSTLIVKKNLTTTKNVLCIDIAEAEFMTQVYSIIELELWRASCLPNVDLSRMTPPCYS
ncbi:hypothetical protein KEM48_004102 [Puccinia striiformis f. sp. tritici PST-130]|nr:hypothetical protein KEM48_004102 [Puccinia striiformis f. sp. tritici PST-130]